MVDKLGFLKRSYVRLRNYHPSKYLIFLYFFVPIMIALFRAINLDNDFWFLNNTGKYIINNGFPTIEPFTIHQNFSFIVQQWLSDVIFYYIYLFFGGWGIVFFTMLQFFLIIFISYKLTLLISDGRVSLASILTIIISSLLALNFVRSRPQMFDFILLMLTIYLLELYIRKRNNKYLYFLPIVSLLLINLHASSFFMLFLFMLPYLINSFKFKFLCFESEGYPKKGLFIVFFVMLFTGFINPYGLKGITYIFTSYGNYYINNLVGEMKYPSIDTFIGILIYSSIFLVLFCYIFNKKEKIKLRYFLLLLGTIVLALSSIKGYSFFIIGAIFSLADYLKDYFKVYVEEFHYSRGFKVKYCFILVLMIVVLIGTILVGKVDFYNTGINEIINYLLKEEKIDKDRTVIYTSYDDGSFAEYRGLRVYLDPRAEVFLKKNNHQKDVLKEYVFLQRGRVDVEQFLKNYNFDYLILSEYDYLYKYYLKFDKSRDYKKVYTENVYSLKHYLYKKVK